jgi:hypothetical protein
MAIIPDRRFDALIVPRTAFGSLARYEPLMTNRILIGLYLLAALKMQIKDGKPHPVPLLRCDIGPLSRQPAAVNPRKAIQHSSPAPRTLRLALTYAAMLSIASRAKSAEKRRRLEHQQNNKQSNNDSKMNKQHAISFVAHSTSQCYINDSTPPICRRERQRHQN